MTYWCIDCELSSKNEKSFCGKCNSTNVINITGSNISIGDILTLKEISNNKEFIKAMIELKEKDIIEYNLKMSQFKSQIGEQKSNNDKNQVSCPKCKSTSITTGARGVNWTWGLIGASKTVNRCANCGHTWKP